MIRESVKKYSRDYWTMNEIIEESIKQRQIGPFSVIDNVNKVVKKLGWRRIKLNSVWYVVPPTMDDDFNILK
ncbi:MAG: hypothetical protein WC998_06580 [Candidatus Paceibacterota bacterium]